MGKKSSIYLIRTQLQMTGEEFGSLFKVGKSTISKWEKDASSMSLDQKKKMSETFKIPICILSNTVDTEDKRKIMEAIFAYNCNNNVKREKVDQTNANYGCEEESLEISKLKWLYAENPAVLNILVAAAEKYVYGRVLFGLSDEEADDVNLRRYDKKADDANLRRYDEEADDANLRRSDDESDYANWPINDDDPYVIIISTALEAALGKKKKRKPRRIW